MWSPVSLLSLLTAVLSLVDHETAIMHRLQEVVLEHTPLLLSVMEHSAELDW